MQHCKEHRGLARDHEPALAQQAGLWVLQSPIRHRRPGVRFVVRRIIGKYYNRQILFSYLLHPHHQYLKRQRLAQRAGTGPLGCVEDGERGGGKGIAIRCAALQEVRSTDVARMRHARLSSPNHHEGIFIMKWFSIVCCSPLSRTPSHPYHSSHITHQTTHRYTKDTADMHVCHPLFKYDCTHYCYWPLLWQPLWHQLKERSAKLPQVMY